MQITHLINLTKKVAKQINILRYYIAPKQLFGKTLQILAQYSSFEKYLV